MNGADHLRLDTLLCTSGMDLGVLNAIMDLTRSSAIEKLWLTASNCSPMKTNPECTKYWDFSGFNKKPAWAIAKYNASMH